jgi:hypothetical protein
MLVNRILPEKAIDIAEPIFLKRFVVSKSKATQASTSMASFVSAIFLVFAIHLSAEKF